MNLKASKKMQQEERTVTKAPDKSEYLDDYASELQKLARIIPTNRTFIIWPDNFLHTETRPELIQIAERNGFTVIDLYELFGNQVETLSWDTVHPSPKSIEDAAQYIHAQLYSQ